MTAWRQAIELSIGDEDVASGGDGSGDVMSLSSPRFANIVGMGARIKRGKPAGGRDGRAPVPCKRTTDLWLASSGAPTDPGPPAAALRTFWCRTPPSLEDG